ncbi:DUF2313 domain-containing protein [Orbaceae bacterium ESL0721]|nr:DUF2313 domain-containing protein [Orbaceae bacterium ESL0721]
MAMTAQEYQSAGLQLLPSGKAWNKELGSELANLQLGFGYEFARIEQVGEQLLNEIIPTHTLYQLKEWEEFTGLPDCSVDQTASIVSRRAAICAKLRMTGSLSYRFLEQLAAERGYKIEIKAHHPHHCLRDIDYPLYPNHNWYMAYVYIKGYTSSYSTVLDNVLTPLKIGDYGDLQCLLERYKDAHINFIYIDEGMA